MDINRKAPVLAKGDVNIAADTETVWKVLASIEHWPEWDPGVRSVSLDGPVAKGTVFRWKTGRRRIACVIENVKRARLLAWSGRMRGIKAIHVWRLEPAGPGTHFVTEASWQGMAVRLFRGSFQRALDKAIAAGLDSLKAEAERRAKPRA